jgi:hypothetical protein
MDKHIVVDPTLGVFEGEYTARPGVASPRYATIIHQLPVQLRRSASRGGLPASRDEDRIHRASFQAMLDVTGRLYRAGIQLVIGTDGIEGLMLDRELELWVQAGIPPERVQQIATIGAARVARTDHERAPSRPGSSPTWRCTTAIRRARSPIFEGRASLSKTALYIAAKTSSVQAAWRRNIVNDMLPAVQLSKY